MHSSVWITARVPLGEAVLMLKAILPQRAGLLIRVFSVLRKDRLCGPSFRPGEGSQGFCVS